MNEERANKNPFHVIYHLLHSRKNIFALIRRKSCLTSLIVGQYRHWTKCMNLLRIIFELVAIDVQKLSCCLDRSKLGWFDWAPTSGICQYWIWAIKRKEAEIIETISGFFWWQSGLLPLFWRWIKILLKILLAYEVVSVQAPQPIHLTIYSMEIKTRKAFCNWILLNRMELLIWLYKEAFVIPKLFLSICVSHSLFCPTFIFLYGISDKNEFSKHNFRRFLSEWNIFTSLTWSHTNELKTFCAMCSILPYVYHFTRPSQPFCGHIQ